MSDNVLKNGLEWLASMRRDHMTSTVVYRRGQITLDVPATIGKPDAYTQDSEGIRLSAMTIDFLITSYEFTPTFSDPEIGDKIIYEDREYEVFDFAGQGHWKWCGIPGGTIRIHTKQVN